MASGNGIPKTTLSEARRQGLVASADEKTPKQLEFEKKLKADRAKEVAEARKEKHHNIKYTEFIVAVHQLGLAADHNDIEDMRGKFYKYLKLCAKNDIRVTNMTAYDSIGIDKNTASAWLNGKDKDKHDIIAEIKSICSQYREMLMANGELNPVVGIWWQKNFDGLVDAPAQNTDKETTDTQTTAKIKDKYKDLIDDA